MRLPPSRAALRLASAFDATAVNRLGLFAQRQLLRPWARALNYHDVPRRLAHAFEAQLRFFAAHFASVGPAELLSLQAGRWPHPKPGLLLTFDDGLRSHAEVVAPLLEKYGFRGWFNVPVAFVDAKPEEQVDFAREHRIDCDASWEPGERMALSWDDVLRLDAAHEVCCHTLTHRRLGPRPTPAELELEVAGAKRRLEERLGHEVRGFTWVGGEEWSYTHEAAEAVRAAGFRYAFMTNSAPIRPGCDLLQLQRTNVEADYPPHLVRFCLSGFYDLRYLPKRRRVVRLTQTAPRGR